MPEPRAPFYVTTPIYYVNDKPHVGHCYTTLLADVLARFMRMAGRDVFFLTGTDEHSERVAERAVAEGFTPRAWADRNAEAFRAAFAELGFTNDDFIRTTEDRHIDRVLGYVSALQASGDVYQGEYTGWWDHSQEEYLTETVAREHGYTSPVTGRELVKRTETNYFFRLSKYADRLKAHIDANPGFIRPEARKNEVLGRLREGLQDVPMSRAGDPAGGWGIKMPADEHHRIYVWIDALFNYLSCVDAGGRERFWPAEVHLLAKDILWFHAVIWPCMLMALDRPLPACVYAHAYWVREGRKMSKTLGNFIDMPTIAAYRERFGDDAFRWYMVTQGPLGATDSDFSYAKFVEVYNADLANGLGNAGSRVCNMIVKYFDGLAPARPDDPSGWGFDLRAVAAARARAADAGAAGVRLDDLAVAGLEISNEVDRFINESRPFTLAKQGQMEDVGRILYACAEALRIAAVLLSPVVPTAAGRLLANLGQPGPGPAGAFAEPLEHLARWGRLEPGTRIVKGEALFPRADPDDPEPGA